MHADRYRSDGQWHLILLAVHEARKNNANQLGILREILFNERDVIDGCSSSIDRLRRFDLGR
jgi:hypothetical protein